MLSVLRSPPCFVVLFAVVATALLCAADASGQTAPTVVLPYTISTIAGGGATTTAGSACFAGSTLKATDTFGDGCPATQAVFGAADFRGGVATDQLGNVYVVDTTNNLIRKIDPRSGLITVFVGGNTICSTAVDKTGDGCLTTATGGLNQPRGIGSDPYGNILIAGYGDNLVHLVCNVVSPLCTAAQVGFMRVAAGCTTVKSASGTAGVGNQADGLNATPSGTCSASVVELDQPRGVNADRYGNIYIGDTGNSRFRVVAGPVVAGVTNPLIAILQLNPVNSSLTAATAAGNIYALVGGPQFTVPASGAPCSAGSSSNALDAFGDGCPFYNTSETATGGFTQGITADSFGDAIFTDSNGSGRVRVVYAGGTNNPMTKIIAANNPSVTTPQIGYVYTIAGGGSTALAVTPVLGSSAVLDGNLFRVSTDANGNIFVGDGAQILFIDVNTGYIRKIGIGTTACAGSDAAGDGCPATQSNFLGSNNVLTPALDNLGNLYFSDGTHLTVRKISSTSFAPTAIGTSATPGIFVHAPAGTTSVSTTLAANSDFTLGAQSCTANTSDQTYDCIIPVSFTPTQVGPRDGPIQIQANPSGVGTTINTSLTSVAIGANLVFDPAAPATPATQTLGSSAPISVAVDGHGDVYTVNSSAQIAEIAPTAPATSTPISAALSATPNQIAVGTDGSVYAATPGSASITKLSLTGLTYATQTITNSAIASAQAIAVDANGNVYVADNTTGAVIKFSQTTGIAATLTATALNNPVALALDGLGNVLVADKGAGVVYRLRVGGITTGLPPTVTVTGTISPVGVAVDPAGDVYIADASSNSIIEVPVSGAQVTVATGFTALNGIAVDGAGSVYVSDSSELGIVQISRNNFAFNFGTNISEVLGGTITNAGNAASTGFAQGDSGDYQLAGAGSTCSAAATSVSPGAACTIAASFTPTPTGSGAVPNTISFLPTGSTTGSLMLTGTKTGSLATTTTTIGGQTPAAPVYSAPGAAVTFTVTVLASTGTAIGNVSAAVDGGTPVTYPLNASGVATVSLTGLTAGPHTVSASYPTQSGVVGSTATPVVFSVAQATTAVSWTPATLTQQFSQAIGTSVFNATSGGVAGAYVYSATPSGGTAIAVDAASYLPVGTYSLAVNFTPTDAVDYMPSSATVASYTVAKATTTAAVGVSANVVAADGSGNFSSVAAAVAALPATGGTIYIAPGTYSGQFTISYPNVALRGLGGDATKVVMTAEGGAFSAPFPPGVTAGNNGAQGDQGSATVVVDKSTIGGVSYTPNLFYAENLSIVNTYDSDATNSNTLAVVGGNCTANQPATNNFALYNAGTLCGTQALALWIRSDKAVLNNVRLTSLQDTLYAGSQGCGTACVPARQYYWKGYITGDVDYIFGDAAAVFDQTTFFTTYHGLTATGTETIEAQQKLRQTGSSGDYLSGYIFNSANLTSQSPGMTNLYFGRPYGQYSTFIMLNTTVDQVNQAGWIEFSGDTNLPTSTYAEFNTMGPGGATVSQRETVSLRPESLTAAQAAQYAPLTFLGTPSPDSWDPTQGLATGVNGFVPAGSAFAATHGQSLTILARPQTPGGGAIPTGTYSLSDGATVLQSGTLDASGNVYFTTNQLSAGVHNITLSYSGDANFSGSSTATPFVITIGGTQTALNVTTTNAVYGSPVNATVTVTQASPTNPLTGTISLMVDSGTPITMPISGSSANFTLTGLSGGAHNLVAVYSGDANNGTSTGSGSVTLAKVNLTVTAPTVSVSYGAAIPAYTSTYNGFLGTDTAASALTGAPSLVTMPAAPVNAGAYPITASSGTLASSNYSFVFVNGLLTITRAATTTTLASSNANPGQNMAVTFTATVTSTAKGTPTGSVSFYNGTTLLNDITLPPSGIATFSTNFATVGAAAITAVYSGDGNYATSTSSAASETTVTSGFAVSATPTILTIKSGASGTLALTLTPTGNFQAAATFACSGLPAAATCAFSPSTVNFAGNNAPATSQLTIATNVQTSSLGPLNRRERGNRLAGLIFLPGLLFAGAFATRRRYLTGRFGGLLMALLIMSGLMAAVGCGGSSTPSTAASTTTPVGTYSVGVTASAVNGGAVVTQQFTATVTITQ
jgi:pectin methylesterase-like acyl-CoA thioesterase